MACLSLGFWEAVAVWVVVLIAIVALLRLLIAALGGGAPGTAFWPPVYAPWSGPAPSGLLGFVAAALNIVIWAIIMIAVIYLIFALLSCLIGAVGGLPRLR
jgi:hypothetical protein